MKKQISTLRQIIKILSDGKYHDGNTIGSELGITRSAVWKAVKKLESYGVEITSVKSKGYRLQEPIQLLDKEYITSNAKHNKFSIDLFESINSTNDYLKGGSAEKHPSFCLAEQQTQGRGRLGRNWHSPFGKNIYLSCHYLFQKDISSLAGLSLVVGLAIISTLKKFLPPDPDHIKIKWPNDILFDGKKIGGVLIDIQAEANCFSSATIGIGLNVNMLADKDHKISQAWTSMRKISGNSFDRNEICLSLIDTLLEYLKRFVMSDLSEFIPEWKQVDYLFGKTVHLKVAKEKITGIAKGVDHLGQLLLEFPDSSVKAFSSGDVSIAREKT